MPFSDKNESKPCGVTNASTPLPSLRGPEAVPAVAAQNDVISKRHSQALASGLETMRELNIFSGWGRIPGRVVVPGQGTAGAEFQGFPKEFARTDEARRGRAVGQHTVG